MNVIKAICYWVAYIIVAIVKMPFTLIVVLGLLIEQICMRLMGRLTKWYGDDTMIDSINTAFELTAYGSECLGEVYSDMKIES